MVPRLLPGRRGLVPGLLRAGHRLEPRLALRAAVRDGDTWRVTGQKVWTSLAQFAERCVLLPAADPRVGPPRNHGALRRHGLTRHHRSAHRDHARFHEFSEVFFDDVVVPTSACSATRAGWSVAMDLLPYERSTALWQRAAFLHRRLELPRRDAPPGALDRSAWARSPRRSTPSVPARERPSTVWPRASTSAPRPRSTRCSWPRPSRRCSTSPPTRSTEEMTVGDDSASQHWRTEYLYSPGGLDLRRQLGDPAQHHRPPAPRPRERPLMDGEDLELFERSLHGATESHRAPTSMRRSTSWAGPTRSPSTAGRRSRCCSSSRGPPAATSAALDRVRGRCARRRSRRRHRRRVPTRRPMGPPRLDRRARPKVRGIGSAALRRRPNALVVARSDAGTAAVHVARRHSVIARCRAWTRRSGSTRSTV